MNWKASLLGAVLVAVAGLIVGIAVGGKTKTTTSTRTETVVSTTKVTVTSPALPASNTGTSTTSSSNTTSTPTTTNGGAGGSSQQYYSTYLSGQDTGALDNSATNASLDSNASSLELKGQTYTHAVAIDLSGCCSNLDSYQLPVPGFASFSCALAGLETNASHKSSYQLTIYKDNDNAGATVLYSATFTGPSGTHPIKFKTHGATALIFDFKKPAAGEPESDQFIMADPVVTTS